MYKITYYETGQVADLLGVAITTVRRWAGVVPEHLSVAANPPRGAHRRFTESDVEVLRRVQELVKAGIRTDALGAYLTPPVERGEEEAIQTIAEALSRLSERGDRMARLEADVAGLKREMVALREAVQRLQAG